MTVRNGTPTLLVDELIRRGFVDFITGISRSDPRVSDCVKVQDEPRRLCKSSGRAICQVANQANSCQNSGRPLAFYQFTGVPDTSHSSTSIGVIREIELGDDSVRHNNAA
jgi:hypothetical protein